MSCVIGSILTHRFTIAIASRCYSDIVKLLLGVILTSIVQLHHLDVPLFCTLSQPSCNAGECLANPSLLTSSLHYYYDCTNFCPPPPVQRATYLVLFMSLMAQCNVPTLLEPGHWPNLPTVNSVQCVVWSLCFCDTMLCRNLFSVFPTLILQQQIDKEMKFGDNPQKWISLLYAR